MLLSNNNNSKSVRLFLITVLITSMTATTILSNMNITAVHAQKSCEEKKWSDCKGTKGWYTHHGNHHCFKGEKDCYNKEHYHE